jgi:uncharacterized protein (DUF486 family)
MKKTPPAVKKTLPDNRRRWLLLIWGAGVLALALRLFTAWEIARGEFASSIFLPSKFTDLRTYMLLAQQVAEGTFEGPFYYQPFYYSVFLVICRWLSGASVWVVILVSWLIALGEYCLMVPANRIGVKTMSLEQLKIVQEAVALLTFVPFSIFIMKQSVSWNYAAAACCIFGAVYFIFKG